MFAPPRLGGCGLDVVRGSSTRTSRDSWRMLAMLQATLSRLRMVGLVVKPTGSSGRGRGSSRGSGGWEERMSYQGSTNQTQDNFVSSTSIASGSPCNK